MSREVLWRLISDYIGAGDFVLEPERLVVGTDRGVSCVPRGSERLEAWKADLGSRCIGVRKRDDGSLFASCRGGLFLLSEEGVEKREKLFAEQLVHEGVPYGDGLLVAAGNSLLLYNSWEKPSWRFDLREVLGESVESIRFLNLFACGRHVVAGAVDYDSGIGRVIVMDPEGSPTWMSEPGPLSETFPAGDDAFVWCLTGYGKFESRLSRLDGEEVWLQDFAGFGALRGDGSIAMIIGSNESPRWDHWEYRQIDAGGKLERELRVKGRAAQRPCCHEDGSVYLVSYVFQLDPSSSRVDYTNFFAMPQELHFQHLVGIRKQIPEYDIYLQKIGPSGEDAEIIYHVSGSFSLARPLIVSDEIVFCDGPDIIAVAR